MTKTQSGFYTVKKLAGLAGISVRTLHHFDQIGLLVPRKRTDAGYRLYGPKELQRLQHILFFRELEVPLQEIRKILDQPDFDRLQALQNHHQLLKQRVNRLQDLIQTLNKTIRSERKQAMPLDDKDLYQGFSKEKIESYKQEIREKYDPELVAESDRRIKQMSKGQWNDVQTEGEEVSRALSELTHLSPDNPEVQQLIARHHAWIENFYSCNAQVYAGLGQMYAENPEFRAHYDKFKPGLADFMAASMRIFADSKLR